MSNYSQLTSFAPKDALTTGNPAKLIKGAEIDPEFSAISVAIASKLDTSALAAQVGTQVITVATTTPGASTIGFRGMPLESQSGNYTFVLSDQGKAKVHPLSAGAGDTFTIPSNAAVPYEIGTVLGGINLDTNDLSISINTDTMYLSGTTLTGTRTVGQNGEWYAIKVATTTWLIKGTNLS